MPDTESLILSSEPDLHFWNEDRPDHDGFSLSIICRYCQKKREVMSMSEGKWKAELAGVCPECDEERAEVGS